MDEHGDAWEGRALTFFVTSAQRRHVLRVLSRLHARRETALLRLVGGVEDEQGEAGKTEGGGDEGQADE